MSDTSPPKATSAQEAPADEVNKATSKKVIQTGALSEFKVSKNPAQEKEISEALPQIHSLLGHTIQGDSYRNDLDLAFERIVHDADAPEYQAPPSEDAQAVNDSIEVSAGAFEPFSFDELGELESANSTSDQGPIESSGAPSTRILGEFSMGALENLQDQAKTHTPVDVDRQSLKEEEEHEDLIMDTFDRLGSIPTPASSASAKPHPQIAEGEVRPVEDMKSEDTIPETPIDGGWDADTWGESLGEINVEIDSVEIEYTPASNDESDTSEEELPANQKAPNDPFASSLGKNWFDEEDH